MMKHVYHNACVLGIVLAISAGLALAEKADPRAERFADDHVLVKFSQDEVLKSVPDYRKRGMRGVEEKLKLPRGARVRETQFAQLMKQKRGAPESEAEDLSIFMYIDLPNGFTPDQAIAGLKRNPMIEYVEKDPVGSAGSTFPTNEPLYSSQWQFGTVEVARVWAPEAWDFTQGTSSITVAILDTGCNTNLQDFWGRAVPGWDFVNNDADPNDDTNHGTSVASLLGATGDNSNRMAGVDWRCRLMPLKVLDRNGNGLLSKWAEATYYAVSNGAKVINLSAGSLSTNTTLADAIKWAVSNGVTYVTITGNDSLGALRFPGSMNETITVGGITKTGTQWIASNYGTNIDLVAPCTNLTVLLNFPVPTWTGDAAGTSYAAPMVSGAASLLLALDPSLNSEQIRDLLCAGAEDRLSTDTNDVAGWDTHYGWGKLNIYNSMRLLKTQIDTIKATNSTSTYLSWPCTKNAQSNQPYGIFWADDLNSTNWTQSTTVTYTSLRAHWTGLNGGSSNRYYRTFIKKYKSWQ